MAKPQRRAQGQSSDGRQSDDTLALSVYILVLRTLSIELSILALSPVYGSTNAQNSSALPLAIGTLLFLAVFLSSLRNRRNSHSKYGLLLASTTGCAVPVVIDFCNGYSEVLGANWGPFFAMSPSIFLNCAALHYVASSFVTGQVIGVFGDPGWITTSAATALAYAAMATVEHGVHMALNPVLGVFVLSQLGRQGFLAVMSCFFALLIRSKSILMTLPIIFLAFSSTHIPLQFTLARLNASLEPQGYRVIARQESVTGYVSVVDNVRDGYRVLRCDHSLLGGEWTRYPPGVNPKLREPIYAIFVMLEAVRLAQIEEGHFLPPKAENEQQALFM